MKESAGNQNIFHCQYKGCLYVEGSERYFTNKKNLNQHIAKVHAEKKYFCTKCQKGFANDWFRKHHEKSCESKWQCSCGSKYQYRESLLTHCRRSQHMLPEEVLSKKKPLSKLVKKENQIMNPLVIIIQPTVTYIPYKQPATMEGVNNGTRFILPKQPQPLLVNINSIHSPIVDESCNETHYLPTGDSLMLTPISDLGSKLKACSRSYNNVPPLKQVSRSKTVAETQTCDPLQKNILEGNIFKNLESKGSQCSGSVTKGKVNIESTYTQTMESAVVKMKKRNSRSRRKSVAVTTDSSESMLPTQSLWSEFENFFFPKDAYSKSDKYSSGTQTSPGCSSSSKVLCDSQTLTDNELFEFPWPVNKEQELMDDTDTSFQVLSDMATGDSLVESQLSAVCESDLFPLKCSVQSDLISETNNALEWLVKSTGACTSVSSDNSKSLDLTDNGTNTIESNNSILTSIFNSCFPTDPKSDVLPSPENINMSDRIMNENFSSDINANLDSASESSVLNTVLHFTQENANAHTQTSLNNVDYSGIFTNMETQTTGDFLFSDLEFLDTETQTPWNDLQNDALPIDQLSIEIQTDFSSLVSDCVSDFTQISSSSMGDCQQSCTEMAVVGRHMETQTQDAFTMPQLTNSEAQTLFASEYLFS